MLSLLCVLGLAACYVSRGSTDRREITDRARLMYDVRLEVTCDRCTVTYWIGANGETIEVDREWSESLQVTPLLDTTVHLEAAPENSRTRVHRLRILANGEVVVEEPCNGCAGRRGTRVGGRAGTVFIEATLHAR